MQMPGSLTHLTQDLTAAQEEAVHHQDGPLLVLAGPGSGKTTVVTRRIAQLVAAGIDPADILGLTFTNKAAGEMQFRIRQVLSDQGRHSRGLTIATFHSFCARILREHAESIGITPRFTIYDASDQKAVVKQAIKDVGLDERNFTPASVLAAISRAKNVLQEDDAYAEAADDFYTRSIAGAYRAYTRILARNEALDFDDLLLLPARAFQHTAEFRHALQEQYRYLLIDEYQDTNHAQFTIATGIAATHRNICVVGDPDQSIYGWRGADIGNILEFEAQYRDARVISLGQNFRSTGHIVAAADALIRHNTMRVKRELHTALPDGILPCVIHCHDEHDEADVVISRLRSFHDEKDMPWRNMAVAYRMNAQSRVLEHAFGAAQVPYVIARGTAYYERREIKNALAYLRLILNPGDEISLLRVLNTPPRGIGKTSLERLARWRAGSGMPLHEALVSARSVDGISSRAAASMERFVAMVSTWRKGAFSETAAGDARELATLVELVVQESGLADSLRKHEVEEDLDRLGNLEELINAASEFDSGTPGEDGDERPAFAGVPPLAGRLAAWLESIALVSDADAIDPEKGAVTLLTLHAAKGLEFDAVVIVGCEEGLLPHSRSVGHQEELEEERRLCFVGMTRARRCLVMTRARQRTIRGLRDATMPSQFLTELPEDHVEVTESVSSRAPGGGQFSSAPGKEGVSAAFPVGCLVAHPRYGIGRVQSLQTRPAGASARVTFQSVGEKTLILEYAGLERVE